MYIRRKWMQTIHIIVGNVADKHFVCKKGDKHEHT